jgi:hypothetical protein
LVTSPHAYHNICLQCGFVYHVVCWWYSLMTLEAWLSVVLRQSGTASIETPALFEWLK